MEPANYTDPLEEALSHGSQRLAQLASLLGATGQVVWQHRALADARRSAGADRKALRVITNQERSLHQQARLAWAPALDPQWLANATLIDVARAWASAVASAGTDPSADTARRKCEDKLRKLHPYAMGYYDRLRADGTDPLEAMRQAAPLFTYASVTRTGDPAPARPALEPGHSDETDLKDIPPTVPPEAGPGTDDMKAAELRGQQIVDRLQTGTRESGRPYLSPEELALILDATTNLPDSIIDRLTHRAEPQADRDTATMTLQAQDTYPSAAAAAPVAPASGANAADTPTARVADAAAMHAQRSPTQLAAESFPHTAIEAIRSAGTSRGLHPGIGAARSPVLHKTKRQNRSL